MKLKVAYRVKNWKQYNQALRDRGNITLWFTEEALAAPPRTPNRGRPTKYTTAFIHLALSIRHLFKLPLRATQGLMNALLLNQGIEANCCDFSLLSKRAPEVGAMLERLTKSVGKVMHLVVDSTGLKVYGDGEWKTRIHGAGKRRTWRKLHLAVDAETFEIVGHVLTDNATSDGQALSKTISKIDEIGFCYGDGAYDQLKCYGDIWQKRGRPIVPPRKGSDPHRQVWTMPEQLRMLNVQGAQLLGRKSWKVGTGYHRRSLAETSMGRMKSTFGGILQSRSDRNQVAEAAIKVDVLNRLTRLGMPRTETAKIWVR